MATRSTISIKTQEGNYFGIYCHFDGYRSGVGAELLHSYDSEEKIMQLIELGDISSLGRDTGSTIAYGRDRGEEGTEARQSTIYPIKGLREEFNYLFSDGKWKEDGEVLDEINTVD